ncbi:MAG: hypothetical protein M9921_07485 [Fimbriimonadaceae bacterium]|nr:hypothetical protein [Fimbriimonadaceae bacterium]
MDKSTGTRPPLVTRKMMIRFVGGLFTIAALLLGYQWYRGLGGDIDLPFSVDTVGMIAAVQEVEDGNQVVLIDPQGKLVPSPGYKAPASDRDPVWRPDGNRIFFSSDREDNTYNIFRWNPGSQTVTRRTFGSRAKTTIEFPSPMVPNANDFALITSGGFVLQLDPTDGSTPQVLPPVGRERSATSEGGVGSQFDALYEHFGSSVRRARWAGNGRDWIVAVMRNDLGEVLILQNLGGEQLQPPFAVIAGERVEFDVNPKTGEVVYVAIGFQFPDRENIPEQFIENGRIKKPFQHMVGVIDPNDLKNAQPPIAASNTDDLAFTLPRVSPDGSTLMLVTGKHTGSGQVESADLVVMPARGEGGKTATAVIKGAIQDPSWAPDSDRILFVMTDQGKRAIHEIRRDGTGLRNITGQLGDFGHPQYSPQVKK